MVVWAELLSTSVSTHAILPDKVSRVAKTSNPFVAFSVSKPVRSGSSSESTTRYLAKVTNTGNIFYTGKALLSLATTAASANLDLAPGVKSQVALLLSPTALLGKGKWTVTPIDDEA